MEEKKKNRESEKVDGGFNDGSEAKKLEDGEMAQVNGGVVSSSGRALHSSESGHF